MAKELTMDEVIVLQIKLMETIKRKKQSKGITTCPCCAGKLFWAKSKNERTTGKCEKEGCLCWME